MQDIKVNYIKAIDINNGLCGVAKGMNEVNFLEGVKVLHCLYGMSYRGIAKLAGVNYNTLKANINFEQNTMSRDKTIRAVANLKANLLGYR